MPRAPSEEEIQLRKRARRRLVGAILLVTAAVVILPMVLDQEPRPVTQDIAIHIPSKGGGDFAPKVAPPAEAPRASPRPPAPKPAPAEPAAEAPGPKAEPEPSKPAPEKPAETAVAAKPEGAVPAAEGKDKSQGAPGATAEAFVVQLDAFSNPENAKQQQKRLADAGIKSFTDTVRTQKGELTRVRVGPYPSREQAEQMRDRLARMGVKSVVVAK